MESAAKFNIELAEDLNIVGSDEGPHTADGSLSDKGKVAVDLMSDNIAEKDTNSEPSLSKRQRKRLMKREQWLSRLPAKRAKEKMKLKIRKIEAIKNNVDRGPTRQQLKSVKMKDSECKVGVALDFSFDDLMSPKDICKTINQTLRSYSANRRVAKPVQFYLVNLNGKSRQEMGKHTGYENWDVHIHSETYLDIFEKESIVYLTSDSDNVVETFDPAKIYVIGALVDHNSQKGLCYNVATTQGIDHARLPIQEYLHMSSRKVLAVNHVFEIIVRVCNGMSWKEAFLKSLPQRKGAVSRRQGETEDQEEEGVETAAKEEVALDGAVQTKEEMPQGVEEGDGNRNGYEETGNNVVKAPS